MGLFGKANIEKLKAKGDITRLAEALGGYDLLRARAALLALQQLGNVGAVTPLLGILKGEQETLLHASEVVRALGALGDSRAVEPLLEALEDNGTRNAAILALAEIGDPRAIERVIGVLGRVEHPARDDVALALAKFGEDILQPLIDVLLAGSAEGKHLSNTARELAATALGLLGNSGGVEPLLTVLRDPTDPIWSDKLDEVQNVMVYQAAATALGRIGDSRAVAPLVAELSSDYGSIPAVADALADLGGDDAEAAITEHWLEDPYRIRWAPTTMELVFSRAAQTHGPRAREALRQVAEDVHYEWAYPEVQDAAARTLAIAFSGPGDASANDLETQTVPRGDLKWREIRDVQEAVDLLFEKAMPRVDDEDAREARSSYSRLQQTWGSSFLAEGAERKVRKIIYRNLKARAGEPGFRYFEVESLPTAKCARVDAMFPNYFSPIRVWRVGNVYYACGTSDFQ